MEFKKKCCVWRQVNTVMFKRKHAHVTTLVSYTEGACRSDVTFSRQTCHPEGTGTVIRQSNAHHSNSTLRGRSMYHDATGVVPLQLSITADKIGISKERLERHYHGKSHILVRRRQFETKFQSDVVTLCQMNQ